MREAVRAAASNSRLEQQSSPHLVLVNVCNHFADLCLLDLKPKRPHGRLEFFGINDTCRATFQNNETSDEMPLTQVRQTLQPTVSIGIKKVEGLLQLLHLFGVKLLNCGAANSSARD